MPLSQRRDAHLRSRRGNQGGFSRFQEPKPLRFFFRPIQQERNHECMLADKRINLESKIKRLPIDTIKALLIRAGAPPRFAADHILSLRYNPGFRICDNRSDDTNRFLPHFPKCVQIPALRRASFAHFPLRGNMRQEHVTIQIGSHFGGFFPSAGGLFDETSPALFPFLGD